MNISSFAKTVLGVSAAAAMLAGCSGGASQSGLPTASGGTNAMSVGSHNIPAQLLNTSVLAVKPGQVHAIPGAGFMSATAGQKAFVSDAADETVDILAYPGGTQTGQITGLNEPQGLCAQKGKSVWLADTGNSNLVHYSAAGKTLTTLNDAGQYPVGCSTFAGNLAVSNIISTSGGAGSVTIYAGAKGSGTNYTVSNLSRVYFISYDKGGNLYVSGSDASGIPGLAYLKHGGSSFAPVTLDGATINFPGTVQFARGSVVVGDQSGSAGHSVLYQTSGDGTATLTVTGSTQLNSASDAVQCWITAKAGVVVPDAGSATVQYYAYPGGGSPTKTISGFGQPIGATVVK
jgi:hypothetical protein